MSTVQLNHQRPQVLDPLSASLHLRGDHDVPGLLEQMVCEPVFVPLSPSQPVSLVVDGQDVDVQDLSQVVMSAIDEVLDLGAQDVCNQVMQQALTSWDSDSRVPTDELMVVQAAAHHRLPSPRRAVYSARTDVIPAAKEILATGQDDGNLLVALGYAYHPRTLGFWFRDEAAFSEFTQWLTTTSQNFVSRMDPDQAKMLNELCRLSLKDLTESLVLRKDDNDSLEEYSFARVLVWALTTWCSNQRQAVSSGNAKDLLAGPLAFSLSETLLPRTVVLVNVERHARASVRRVDREWRIITGALTNPVKMVTPRKVVQADSAGEGQGRYQQPGGQRRQQRHSWKDPQRQGRLPSSPGDDQGHQPSHHQGRLTHGTGQPFHERHPTGLDFLRTGQPSSPGRSQPPGAERVDQVRPRHPHLPGLLGIDLAGQLPDDGPVPDRPGQAP